MISTITSTIQQLQKDNIVRLCGLIVIALTIFIAVCYSSIAALIIITNYILGIIVCGILLKYQNGASFYFQRLASFCRSHGPKTKYINFCKVCNKLSCTRHPGSANAMPWKNLRIEKHLNESVEHFYNSIVQAFVTSWYANVTSDTTFLFELKYCLRYSTASLVKKILQIDVGNVIANKLVPVAVKHIDDYMYMKQMLELKKTDINKIAIEYLGTRMHIAVSNRKNEISYLRNLVSCLLPNLLPEHYVNCKNYNILIREILAGWVFLPLMDVLADPNIINSLFILIATYKSKGTYLYNDEQESVELLVNFNNRITKPSTFACDLDTIKKNTYLLYSFMKFLKREGSVHLLQFCLDVDEFNNKLLIPDLTRLQLESLHGEATKLFNEYFDSSSANFIHCSSDIVCNFQKLLQDGVYNVAKFRTSEPLYQAYEYALSNLENDFLPLFFHSNEFYVHICGEKVTAAYNKASVNKGRKYYEPVGQSTVSKISSGLGKIKGALKATQPIEGAIYPIQTIEDGTIEDIIVNDCSNIFRDLRTWRVSLTSTDTIQVGSKNVVHYDVNVQRLEALPDSERKQWVVKRKDQDFYTLKIKLIEFHGESEICSVPFPSRRTTMTVEMRRRKYEEFLGKLLQKPSLRGSDLLHSFLTCEEDFTLFVTAGVTTSGDIGNIYQSVAYMLKKEKGQYLDSFMGTFLSSTMKTKQGKPEWAEIGDEFDPVSLENQKTVIPKTFRSAIFNDNFGVDYKSVKQSTSSPFTPNDITESIFYLLKYTFHVPTAILKLYAAVCSIGQQIVDSMLRLYIDTKVRSALNQNNLAYLIGLLEGVIFNPHAPITKEEMEIRRNRAFEELQNVPPQVLSKLLGKEFNKGFAHILEILQNPVYNKQLVYNLLDIVISEMYPHLVACDIN